MNITIYHNPACGTSRTVLTMLTDAGHQPTVIEYLKTPLDSTGLRKLLSQLGIAARDLLRPKGELYETLGLANPALTEEELIDAMATHPTLMNRPVVLTPNGAKLCRPAELVRELL